MLSAGDLVVVAVSGGPDSMCLLDALASSAPQLRIRLHVAYLHHHMREQADSDVRVVAAFAGRLGIPCAVGHADVPEMARERGIGVEEAGRIARYRFLREVREKTGARRIALGHNLNDQAETVLMRLLRGSGTQGLAGIPPVRDDLIRPLIYVPRDQIEEYCRERNIPTIVDVYNLDLRYTRNLMRHKVLPQLAKDFNPSLVDTLARVATVMRWDSELLEGLARTAFEGASCGWGRLTAVDRHALGEMPYAIASRVLEEAWRECSGSSGNLPVDRTQELMLGPEKSVSLPLGVTAEKSGDSVGFYPPPLKDLEVDLAVGETHIPELGLSIEVNITEGPSFDEKSCPPGGAPPWYVEPVARLDYNRLEGRLWLRTRRRGDRFAPLGMGGREQKLQDFFVQRRVPRFYRDFVPLLMSGDDIVWVVGLRISDDFRVRGDTRRMLEATARPYLRCSRNYATIWGSCPTSGRVYS